MRLLRFVDLPQDAWSRAFAEARLAQEWARWSLSPSKWRPRHGGRYRSTWLSARAHSRASQEALHEALGALLAEERVYAGGSRWAW